MTDHTTSQEGHGRPARRFLIQHTAKLAVPLLSERLSLFRPLSSVLCLPTSDFQPQPQPRPMS